MKIANLLDLNLKLHNYRLYTHLIQRRDFIVVFIIFRNIQRRLISANPLGIVIATALSPFLVGDSSSVPMSNYVWMAPAILCEIMTLVIVTRLAYTSITI